jgi:hypothetical protein
MYTRFQLMSNRLRGPKHIRKYCKKCNFIPDKFLFTASLHHTVT